MEVSAKLQDNALKRDQILMERQKLTGSILTILGALMSDVMNETEARLTNQLLFEQTKSRKAFLLRGTDKKYKKVLEGSTTDEFLFGKDLSERIKSTNAIHKIGSKIRSQKLLPLQPRGGLNARGPPARIQAPYAQAGPSNRGGRGRPRLYFRGRGQPFNPVVQNQPRFNPVNKDHVK